MALFTFVLDYKGGTYISQVRGPSPQTALQKWVNALPSTTGGSVKAVASLRREIDKAVPIDGVKSVWCASGTLGRSLALVNIVKTAA